ncbi:dihydrolipoamide acyltransferase E2 component [Microlunatus phosphovorus NM-1]|uniref:Dihydrolipoamide acetyltransferase component of pyruvate dehydrogenase complex n=1 Tax=Microlunatus phosphovorus (strain ATCC 700054 / DSM 10555 / JCM 9379 / NBRC 101784 / NCIMB 13414 / VKM Ac-1990 / NM-1) TaxID=1032480 RepID=F5XJC4_MICPN|nr:dihydrolipoamide acetyltransferase family protein [Microlunatus phosphovorus]BAK33450.1 dihydrolipoamide acyltransferase E2 component [Microlunatus phosphovorus NM-1]
MAIKEFRLPDPGEGLVEADIVTWRVAVGDQVKINDILVEIETSKSLVELPSPYEGTVTGLLVSEGDTVDVGVPIIAIDDGVAAPSAPAAPAEAADGDRVANLVGYGPKQTDSRRRPRKGAAGGPEAETHEQVNSTFAVSAPVSRRADEREPLQSTAAQSHGGPLPQPGPAAAETSPPSTGPVLAKPPVRKLARDLGIDLAAVAGTGSGGVITRADVEAAAAAPAAEVVAGPSFAAPPVSAAAEDQRIPIKGVRKAMAAAMVQSAFTAPHVTVWVETDVTATMDLVQAIRARRDFAEVKVSPLLIVAKAVLIALKRNPALNSSWDEVAQEIVLKAGVNLGIAAATPRGLIVPNIKNADRLSLLELAQAFAALISSARSGKTTPEEMARGSFTITNIGVFGVDGGLPILNPGEAGILAVGQIVRKPWVVGSGDDERIEPRWVTTIGLSFDHRLADGQQGSTFLADVAAILADPGMALVLS